MTDADLCWYGMKGHVVGKSSDANREEKGMTTATPFAWGMPGQIIHKLHEADRSLAHKFFGSPPSWARGTDPAKNPVTDGLGAIPNLAIFSFAEFSRMFLSEEITERFYTVDYDPEDWDRTPAGEADDPWRYMQDCCEFIRGAGYMPMTSPARDLGNRKTSVSPKLPGESNSEWYLRTDIPGAAAAKADAFVIQSQTLTENPRVFSAFVTQATQQALASNPSCQVYAHLSTSYGTASEMAAAIRSVRNPGIIEVPGCYVHASADMLPKLISFFRKMQ